MTALLRCGISALCLGLLIGCEPAADYKTKDQINAEKGHEHEHDHDHGHGAAGPHGGALVELGEEEYHAEVVVDHKAHALTVYLLGKDAKTAATTTATELTISEKGATPLVLKATPLEGETDGKTSKFELVDEKAVHEIDEAGFLHGDLSVKIADKEFSGSVDAHFDGDHDHAAEKPAETPAEKPAETPAEPVKP